MEHGTVEEHQQHGSPTHASEDQDPSLADARLTFVITAISAALFVLAAVLIIMATRMG